MRYLAHRVRGRPPGFVGPGPRVIARSRPRSPRVSGVQARKKPGPSPWPSVFAVLVGPLSPTHIFRRTTPAKGFQDFRVFHSIGTSAPK